MAISNLNKYYVEINLKEVSAFLIMNGTNVTNKKLQKLLYFAQGWFLALNNENFSDKPSVLFIEDFEAWRHGPVVPNSYFEYRRNGSDAIPCDFNYTCNLKEEVEQVLEDVLNVYDKYNGNQLESISHQQDPWSNCDRNQIITKKSMFDYFSTQYNG